MTVFVVALVIGGILLGASVLFGDGHGDVGGDLAPELDLESFDAVIGTFRSLRFWIFFLAFFGLTGTIVTLTGMTSSTLLAYLVSTLVGAAAGGVAVATFRALSRKTTNSVATSSDYVGQTARVLVALGPEQLGKVRVEVKGTTVDLLARADEPFAIGDDVLVVELVGTEARVARV